MSKFWTRAALCICAASVAAPPAAAQVGAPSVGSGVRVTRHHGDGDGHHRRHRDGRGRDVFVTYWNSGEWALYNNRGWEPESYNDWWHARPERNTPRWVHSNQGCQRQYWSGGGWRC
jgi:hypothetical protein